MLVVPIFQVLAAQTRIDTALWNSIGSINSKAFSLKNQDIDSGLKINLKLYDQMKEPYDSLIWSDVLSVTGTLLFNKGNYQESLKRSFKCLEIREALDIPLKIAKIQSNIGNTYYKMDQQKKAIQYQRKSIDNRRKSNQKGEAFAKSYNCIGMSYLELNQEDSALKFLDLALDSSSEEKETRVDVLSNLGQYYLNKDKLPLATKIITETIELQEKRDDHSGLAKSYYNLGVIEIEKREFQKAISKLEIALTYAEKVNLLDKKKEIVAELLDANIHIGDKKKALLFKERYDHLSTLLLKEKAEKNAAELDEKYQNDILKDQNIKTEQQKESKQLWIYGLASTLAIFVLLAFFSVRSYLQKQTISKMELQLKEKEVEELLNQQESASYASLLKGQEEERQRIARDLHDRLGNTLATLRLSLQHKKSIESMDKVDLVDQAIREVREVAQNISSGVLIKHGLNAALNELKLFIEGSTHLIFQLDTCPEINLSQEQSLELYRIVQELVSNTLKHSSAKIIDLQTTFSESNFQLMYEDDGLGFQIESIEEGMGMKNIKKRTEKLSANCNIDSKPGRGTIVIIDNYHA